MTYRRASLIAAGSAVALVVGLAAVLGWLLAKADYR